MILMGTLTGRQVRVLWVGGAVLGAMLVGLGVRWAYRAWLYQHRVSAILDQYCVDPPLPPEEEGLKELGGPRRARALLREYLEITPLQVTNRTAAYYLLSFCDDDVIPELIGILVKAKPREPLGDHTTDAKVSDRMHAADALWYMGRKARSAVPALTAALKDPEPSVRYRAARALGRMGRDAAPAVLDLVTLLSETAAAHVGSKPRDTAIPRCSMDSLEIATLHCTMTTLTPFAGALKAAVPDLVKLLESPDNFIRADAARFLGRIGPPARDAVPQLTKLLRDRDTAVQAVAREALSSIQRPE